MPLSCMKEIWIWRRSVVCFRFILSSQRKGQRRHNLGLQSWSIFSLHSFKMDYFPVFPVWAKEHLGNILILIFLWAWIVTFSFPSSFFFHFYFFLVLLVSDFTFLLELISHTKWSQRGERHKQGCESEVNRGEEQSRRSAVPPDLISYFIPAVVYYQQPPGTRML